MLERASARETAARVAAGAIARQLLARFDIRLASHVFALGPVAVDDPLSVTFERASELAVDAPVRCVDERPTADMIAVIDGAKEAGDTVGGAFEVIARGVPPGLGSYAQWDRKLDGRLAQALMSIPAIKAVGIGRGPAVAALPGSRMHDEIVPPRTSPTTPNAPVFRDSRARPTTPAAWKAASPTARTFASRLS